MFGAGLGRGERHQDSEVQHAPPAGESRYQQRVAPRTGRNLLVLLTVITFIFMKRSILTYFEANVGPHVFFTLCSERKISVTFINSVFFF